MYFKRFQKFLALTLGIIGAVGLAISTAPDLARAFGLALDYIYLLEGGLALLLICFLLYQPLRHP